MPVIESLLRGPATTTVKSKLVTNIKGLLYKQIMRLIFIDDWLAYEAVSSLVSVVLLVNTINEVL